MTRTEYELIYDAFKSHRYKMTDAQEVLAEKILDDLFYPHFDALKGPCLLYTSPSPRDYAASRMPSSA